MTFPNGNDNDFLPDVILCSIVNATIKKVFLLSLDQSINDYWIIFAVNDLN